MKRDGSFKIACVYIGTAIGAGFASGQEIMQFFGVYGYKGIIGVILASFLFSLLGVIILLRVKIKRINNYDELILPLFGTTFGKFLGIVVTIFLFTGYSIMLSGGGAVLNQQFHISYNTGVYIMVLLTFLTFIFSIKGLSSVNSLLVPVIIVGIILTSIFVILKQGMEFSNFNGATITKTGNFVTSSLLYVSYNSITLIVVMASLLPIIKSKKSAIKGGLLGGIGLGVLALFILIPTLILYTDINNLEVPMLKISENIGNKGVYIYGIILLCAMFTTAIANGFGFIQRIKNTLKINELLVSILFCMVSLPMAKIGFSELVNIFYPIFGYLGLFMIVFIIIYFLINKARRAFKVF